MNPRGPISIARSRAGFTLVELMMTIMVLAVVAGMALTQFDPGAAAQVEAFADVVAADLAQIRQLAVTNNSKYCVTFQLSQNRYYYEHTGTNTALSTLPPTIYSNTNNTATRQYFDLNNVPHLGPSVTLNTILAMSSSPTTTTAIEFGPLGATTQAADSVIWLQAGNGSSLRYVPIRVNAVTGLAIPSALSDVAPTTTAPASGS